MAEENPNARWRKMTEAEAKLAAKDQIKATKAQTKASDRVADSLDEMKDQFKGVQDGLDKLAPAAPIEQKEKKHERKQEKKEQKEQKEKRDDRKANKALLDDLRAQVRRSQIEQGLSAKDVAAEHIAGGGGLGGAVKAAAGFKIGQLKHKFDPLNIVKKITGGSKLITALAGKVMGRSEKAIREFADLAPGQELPTSFSGKASNFGGARYNESPSRVAGGDSSSILNTIAINVAKILDRLTKMELSTGKQERLAEDQLDAQRDANAVAGAKQPTRMGKIIDKIKGGAKEAGGGLFDWLADMGKGIFGTLMKTLFSPLGLAFAGLVVAGVLLYKQWDKLKLSFSLLGDSISDIWDAIKRGLTSMGEWVGDAMNSIGDSIIDTGENIIEGVKHLNPFYKGPNDDEKLEALKTAAAGTGFMAGHAQRKLAAMNIDKVAAPGESAAAVAKLSDSFIAKVPAAAQRTAAEGLKRGEYDAAATASLMGVPAAGTPEQKATIGAVTQLATKAYGEVYKDEQGKPLTPSTDKSDQKATRVTQMVQEASKALGVSLSAPQATAISPTEVPAPMPTTGETLAQANDMQRTAAMMQAPGISGAPTIINNVKNNNTNSSTIHQAMAGARSDESSYLRWLDRDYAPA